MGWWDWLFARRSSSSDLLSARVIKGAMLIGQEGDDLIVKIKCENCGAIAAETSAVRLLPGVQSGFMFRCANCGTWDEVKVYCPEE